MSNGRVGELEAALEREKQARADADDRATRANERARQAELGEAEAKLRLETAIGVVDLSVGNVLRRTPL